MHTATTPATIKLHLTHFSRAHLSLFFLFRIERVSEFTTGKRLITLNSLSALERNFFRWFSSIEWLSEACLPFIFIRSNPLQIGIGHLQRALRRPALLEQNLRIVFFSGHSALAIKAKHSLSCYGGVQQSVALALLVYFFLKVSTAAPRLP